MCPDEFDPDVLSGKRANFKLGPTVFKATIVEQHATKVSTYKVQFDSKRHPKGQTCWVDLELPRRVANGEYSFWKLDGYETNIDSDSTESDREEDDE